MLSPAVAQSQFHSLGGSRCRSEETCQLHSLRGSRGRDLLCRVPQLVFVAVRLFSGRGISCCLYFVSLVVKCGAADCFVSEVTLCLFGARLCPNSGRRWKVDPYCEVLTYASAPGAFMMCVEQPRDDIVVTQTGPAFTVSNSGKAFFQRCCVLQC